MLTEAAQADLEEIDEYIAADNPIAADQLLDDLYAAMQRAADAPDTEGSVRVDLTDRDVRFVLVRRTYWIVYVKGGAAAVTILRVLHARREIRRIL